MNEDSLCSALDNTLLQKGDKSAKNSNPYHVPEEFSHAYLSQTEDESSNLLKEDDKDNVKKDNSQKVGTTFYAGAMTLDEELHNCREASDCQSREHGKESQSSENLDKNISFSKFKQKSVQQKSNNSPLQELSSSASCVQETIVSSEFDSQISHEDSEREDIEEDVMSGSYGEISLDRELLSSNKNSDSQSSKEDFKIYPSDENKSDSINEEISKEKKRPDSLVLIQNNDFVSLSKDSAFIQQMHKSQQTSECRTSAEVSPSLSSEEFALHSIGHARSGSETSGLSELQGTLTVDGDLVTFVAEDLQEKIKMSSPVSRVTDSSSFPGSRSSTPSLYRQALQPHFHIVDPHIISDLEVHAKKVATVIDTMLENLSETLQSFSSLTVACMGTYESSVCKTCDAVDANIKSVYQLMAKCEELSNAMQPLYKISGDVKHIKKMLDQLEHIVEHKS